MKYYSEVLESIFDTVEELNKEEEKYYEKEGEKNSMLKEICDLAKERDIVSSKLAEKKNEYIKKYGGLCLSKDEEGNYTSTKEPRYLNFSLFDELFK